MLFKASAAGSLMLLGEYAVMHGQPAIVCAIDKRMYVTLEPRTDNIITIVSENFGAYTTDKNNLKVEPPFHFVLATLKHVQKHLLHGCDITIRSEFSDKIGFGSSAAVTVALLCTLGQWFKTPYEPLDLIRTGRSIIRKVQGLGSGADVAASVMGGMVFYKMHAITATKLDFFPALSAFYSGMKTPTAVAVKKVQDAFADKKLIFQKICQTIGACVRTAKQAIEMQDTKQLGELLKINQGLMEALTANTPELRLILNKLVENKDVYGAKISGSGFGDCVISVNKQHATVNLAGIKTIPISISSAGVGSFLEKS